MKRRFIARKGFTAWTFLMVLGLSVIFPAYTAHSTDRNDSAITLKLGDYRFSPDTIQVVAGVPVRLVLVNTDGITPHNFTLKNSTGALDLDVNVSAGKTREVEFTPRVPGTYSFFCNRKLPFMKSHRDRGMHGTLEVVPAE